MNLSAVGDPDSEWVSGVQYLQESGNLYLVGHHDWGALRKGLGYAQWSGSPLLLPSELAPPLAPKDDTREFGTDTSSASEHPLCSNTDGSTGSQWGRADPQSLRDQTGCPGS